MPGTRILLWVTLPLVLAACSDSTGTVPAPTAGREGTGPGGKQSRRLAASDTLGTFQFGAVGPGPTELLRMVYPRAGGAEQKWARTALWRIPHDWTAAVAFSRDDRVLTAASIFGSMRLWDVATATPVRELKQQQRHYGSDDASPAVAASPDGERFAFTGPDIAAVRVRHSGTGALQAVLRQDASRATALVFSPDGHRLAAAEATGTPEWRIRIYDIATGRETRLLKGRAATPGSFLIRSLCFSPDGRFLAAGVPGGIQVWELPAGRAVRLLQAPAERLAFSHDGLLLFSASGNQIRPWELATGRRRGLLQEPRDVSYVSVIALSPDDRLLASGCMTNLDRGIVRLWDLTTGQCVHQESLKPHAAYSLAFSHDGTTLAAGLDLGLVRLWRLRVLELAGSGSGGSRRQPDGRVRIAGR